MIKHIVTLLTLTFSISAQAHHSMAHFENAISEMEGTLVEIRWRNPHIHFIFEEDMPSGEKKTWELEAGTIYMLGRAGVTEDMFAVGDRIRIAGNKSRSYDDKFWVENILTAGGEEVLVVANGEPRWTDELIGGRRQWTNEAFEGTKDRAVAQGSGIFRVWSPGTGEFQNYFDGGAPTISSLNINALNRIYEIATDAAFAKAEELDWDPYAFDANCEIPGMPRAHFGPHPIEFSRDGDNILLLNAEFYVTRTIHMNSTENPEDQPFSPLGYSVGHWEDENTLIIETSRIDYPFMNLGGVGQSKEISVSEKYIVYEDENRLDYEVIIRDPVMLSEDWVRRGVMLDIGEVLDGEFDCVANANAARN